MPVAECVALRALRLSGGGGGASKAKRPTYDPSDRYAANGFCHDDLSRWIMQNSKVTASMTINIPRVMRFNR